MSICKFFTLLNHISVQREVGRNVVNSQPGDPGQKVVTFYNISCVESLNVVDDKNAI